MIHGLRAGPGIFERHGEIIYAVLWALLLANLVVIVIGVVGAKYLAKIINIPTRILVPIITMLTIIGSFAIRNNIFDVFIMLCFGILGYLLQKTGFSPVAAVIGLILGPLAERSFVTALNLSGGSYAIFFTSAICIVLWLLIVATLVVPYLLENRRARRRQKLL